MRNSPCLQPWVLLPGKWWHFYGTVAAIRSSWCTRLFAYKDLSSWEAIESQQGVPSPPSSPFYSFPHFHFHSPGSICLLLHSPTPLSLSPLFKPLPRPPPPPPPFDSHIPPLPHPPPSYSLETSLSSKWEDWYNVCSALLKMKLKEIKKITR